MDEQYKISLGVDISVDDIQSQINAAENKVSPIKLNVEIDNLNEIKQQLQNLGKNDKNTLTLNTDSLEASLRDVKTIITDIKSSIGTLDSKSGMKSLLSSINQISSALDKASNKFEELNANLSALGKKDFNINFGINMGGSNQIGRNAAYGNKVRNETLPQLKQQMSDLVRHYNNTYKSSLGEFEVLQRMVSGTKLNSGEFFESFLFGKDSVASRMTGGSLASQMQAYKQYIDMFKQAASLKGLDISHITSQFSKSADALVQDAVDVQTGANEMEESFEKLRQIFGGGNNFNVDGLNKQLDSVVKDLGEIRIAIQDLSKGISVDEIVQSFKEMSIVLKDITDNLTIFRNALGNTGNGLSNSVASTTQGLKNNANVLDTFKRSLQNVGMGADEIDVVANRINNLGVQIETLNQKRSLSGDKEILTVDISGIDKLGNAVKLTQEYDAATGELIKSVDKVSTVHQKAGKSADTFAKQQKRAVTDLTNQIDQLNRAAIDQNAARPIKDVAHLDSLESKYNEIISAIQKMGMASNDTFEDERNKVRTLISEYKSLKSEYKNAENVALQMDGNDFASGLEIAKNKLAEFKAQAQGFPQITSTIKELDSAIEGVGDVSSLKEFNNQLRVARSDLSRVKEEAKGLDKIKFGLADKGADGFKQVIASRQAAIDELKKDVPDLQNAMNQLNAAMNAMNTADEANDIQRLKLAYQDYLTALKQVDSQLKLYKQAEDNANKTASFKKAKEGALLRLKGLFSENSEAARRFGARLNEIQKELAECGDTKGLTKINREITNLSREIQNANVKTQTFADRFKKQWQQYTSYFSVASLFSYASQGLRDMFNQVVAIDTAMTELKKVTDETDESYSRFLSNAAKRSKELGTTIDGLVESTADFARLGYGFEESQGLAEVANIYAVVGDEIEGVEDATKSLISTLAAYKDETSGISDTDFAMDIVDKFNEVSKINCLTI